MYQELQKQVFDWFENKYKQDSNFTFSVRQKANKGAELNYFIGTEKSKYFSTTFWYVPVAYPGSSSDLINLVFTVTRNKKIEFHIQFNQTKNPHDEQNAYALEFIESIKPLFKEVFPDGIYAPDANKMEFFAAYSKPIYNSFEELKDDLDLFLGKIIPIVNQQIAVLKGKYPSFIAHRFSSEDQKKMFSKMQERFQKYKIIEELEDDLEEEEELTIIDPHSEFNFPLNQILYGPPGTGKTYHTIAKAIGIANPNFNIHQDREIVKNEYNRLVESGQIVFTTFHQSMSYEDFVEGIKPEIEESEDGEKTVVYEIKKGIFQLICDNAKKPQFNTKEIASEYDFDDAYTQLVSDSIQNLDQNKPIFLPVVTPNLGLHVVGVSGNGNLILKPQYSEFSKEYTVSYSRAEKLQKAFPDLSVIKNIDKEFREVIGGSNSSAYWAVINYINDEIKNKQGTSFEKMELPAQPHILIIDEINRGNVSQIFGELITLIEESKRLGNSEELKVTLPYSKKEFGVPSNLYIIGTMNTADRSVESLDTALRRRFCFEEMLPNLEVLNDKIIEGIELKKLLLTINKRVEILLDRDHTIGHSYFIDVKTEQDLRNTFKNNIIPLLQEYFYGDYEKIGMILGEMFFDLPEKYNKDVFANFPSQNYPESGNMLRLKVIDDTFNIIEALKILMKQDVSN